MDEALKYIYNHILDGDKSNVESAVREVLDAKVSPDKILYIAMIPAMDEVGKLYERGDFFVPEMLVAAQAMRAGLAILKPYLAEKKIEPLGVVAIGTVKGDLHDIGKNLVAMMLEGAGFQVIDLGVDAGSDKYIEAVKAGAQILAMSALLTTTMPQMQIIIEKLKESNLRDKVMIMIGGAPVTESFADKIGADGFSSNAGGAVDLARVLLKKVSK
jgi:5-methyltetrahydrofolate--homocysteine methyltransferase